ncbi:hypothetical protein J3R30DRAFT_233236 [Lentinula aciculospora]|uniref:Uncharacterized protein n=1 Tax=Lentinula aciculospora TaxID=153920 RepID=A0A9W9AAB8_9AGAR|nr:hypothetical protein J3R30DRAFT_233236 [Lentinula aciculospora]
MNLVEGKRNPVVGSVYLAPLASSHTQRPAGFEHPSQRLFSRRGSSLLCLMHVLDTTFQIPVCQGVTFTANLVLAGTAYSVWWSHTKLRIVVKIVDQVPESVLPRSNGTFKGSFSFATVKFNCTNSPFLLYHHASTNEVLFMVASDNLQMPGLGKSA